LSKLRTALQLKHSRVTQQLMVITLHAHDMADGLPHDAWLVVVTGASHGFGKAATICLADALARAAVRRGAASRAADAREAPPDAWRVDERLLGAGAGCARAHFVLIGRDEAALEACRAEVAARLGSASAGWAAEAARADLADAAQVAALVQGVLEPLLARNGAARFARALLLNNAAELPPFAPLAALPAAALGAALQLCVVAPAALAAPFAAAAARGACVATVVHSSSLYALQPQRTWGAYCVSKAAADMLHAVLAAEGGAALRTLNYAPGPLDTAMQAAVRASGSGCDAALAREYRALHAAGRLVAAEASARALVELVLGERFVSGAHVDYYDLLGAHAPAS
jgi:NAD(P)-dependent dehydrogenase (short-subunit alcohol dehydrogenase family)